MCNNLSHITNINSIKQLSEYDSCLRLYFNSFKANKGMVDEILHNTYIKLDKFFKRYPDRVIDGGYVAMSFMNELKDNRKTFNNSMSTLDEEQLKTSQEDNHPIKQKQKIEKMYQHIEEKYSNLHWYDRLVLKYSLEMSCSELSRKSGISRSSLDNTLKKIIKEIRNSYEEDKDNQW